MISRKMPKKIDKLLIIKTGIFILSGIVIFLFFSIMKEIDRLVDEDLLYKTDPRIEFYQSFIPLRKWKIEAPTVNANAAAVIIIDENGKKSLFDKSANTGFPIASITKLMTAVIAMEKYDMDYQLIVSEEAFMKDLWRHNNLFPGETYKVRDLLYASLVESSNTAAQTLAEGRTIYNYNKKEDQFISKMNKKAKDLGMKKTYFSNPTGLDPTTPGVPINRSSPRDLVIFVEYLLDQPMIWEILSTKNYTLRTADGSFKYDMINTNQLLGEIDNIKGGKTGTTARSGGNLLAVFERDDSIVVVVVLGSNKRFEETKSLLNWIEEAYHWKVL